METGAMTNGTFPDVRLDRALRSCEATMEIHEEMSDIEASEDDAFINEEEEEEVPTCSLSSAMLDHGWVQDGRSRDHVTYQEWATATRKAPPTESEGYAIAQTMQSRMAKAPLQYKMCTWTVLTGIGVVTGLLAVCVDKGLEVVYEKRMEVNEHVVKEWSGHGRNGMFMQYLSFTGGSVFLGSIAGALVCFAAPLAAGSGIPEIKCYLNGILLRRVVTKITLLAKAVGIVFSVAAGLPVGKEGPMIHSGSVVGGLGGRFTATFANRFGMEHPVALARERRDFVAAGATAGVAAAFGSPMGACLFAIEEGSSYMNPGILLKLFTASASAAFVSSFFTSLARASEGGEGGDSLFMRLQAGHMGTLPVFLKQFKSDKMEWTVWELPIFICMGTCGGLFGALFCYCNKHLTKFRRKFLRPPRFGKKGKLIIGRNDFLRFFEVIVVNFVLSSVFFWVPMSHHWRPVTMEEPSPTDKLFWMTGTGSLRNLLHSDEDFDFSQLLLFFCIHMTATCVTYGLGVPSGLFVPSLLGGAAMGRLIGQALHPIVTADPGIYAIVGATAMLSGAARITISLAMILMEVTGNSQLSLPIFAAAMFARGTGNKFGRGIYDLHIIELKRVPLLEHDPEDDLLDIPAREVMARDIVSFTEIERADLLHSKLQNCSHNGFPVLRQGRAVGYMPRDALHFILNNGEHYGVFDEDSKVVKFNHMMRQLARKRPGLDVPLADAGFGKSIDLRPYMTKDFHTMSEDASAYSCYMLFRQLGLRHLFLRNTEGVLSGIITRKDLIMMEDLGEEELSEVVSTLQPQSMNDDDSVTSTTSDGPHYQG